MADGSPTNNRNNLPSSQWFAFYSSDHRMIYLMGAILEDYVLRIHRREKDDPRILVGVVEEVGVEGDKAFGSLDELWSILDSRMAEPKRVRNARDRKAERIKTNR